MLSNTNMESMWTTKILSVITSLFWRWLLK